MYALNLGSEMTSDNGRRIFSACDGYLQPDNPYRVEELPTGDTDKEKDIHNWLYTEDGNYEYSPLADPDTPEPTDITSLEAQITYTAMMTDTMLPEEA